MLGAGSILAGVFIGAGIGALSTTAMKEGEEISTGNVRSAGERLAYAVFDDSMSWDEKWAYAFDPGQMVADFVTGVVIGEILDGIMAATQNKLRSIFANNDAAMREALGSGSGNKPYTNSRPSYGKNQVNEVWENAKDPITGKVYDPSGVEITWDKTKPRNGQWDMGHIPGEKYSEMHQLYMDDVISKDEFLEWYRNPKNYRPELPSTNRSHKYE